MMMIYPFDASILDNHKIRTFKNKKGNIKNIVAKTEDFESIEMFYKYLVGNNIHINNQDIKEAYIRYYSMLPKKTEVAQYIQEQEGYTFCKKGRGASKVYTVLVNL